MKTTYIYQKHDWNTNFYIQHERFSREDRYCSHCEDYDTLIGAYDNEAELSRKLKWLFIEGYDVLTADEHDAFWDKYCPPLMRQWELQKLEDTSDEYKAMAENLAELEHTFDMDGLEYKEIDGKINPFYYINSRDIRAHLRSLNYEFSSLEIAWLIWQSKDTSLGDRHRAWLKLIETMPDCSIEERLNTLPQESLHAFLKKLIDVEKRLLNLFEHSRDEAVYSFRYREPGERHWNECETLFYGRDCSAWVNCLGAIAEQVEIADRIIVRKRWLNGTHRDIKIEMDGLRRICKVVSNEVTDEEYPYLCEGLDGLWFDFPTPFRIGDIVVDCRRTALDHDDDMLSPFVYDDSALPETARKNLLKNGCNLDMTAYGLFQDMTSGELYSECMHGYMNLEYYHGELKGKQRVLKATSNYLKGEISIELYSHAYRKILDEENIKHRYCWYTEEGQKLAGLIDDTNEGSANDE